MIHLDLADTEAQMLRETLENDLAKLRMEFGKTESRQWREVLKEKEDFLLRVIHDLEHHMMDELDKATNV